MSSNSYKQKVYITREFHFEAAHFLPLHNGKCQNLHGHSYKMEVTCSSEKDFNKMPDAERTCVEFMVMDFSNLKSVVEKSIIERFDHKLLNDTFYMPTAEVMCVKFFHILENYLSVKYPRVKLEELKLWESRDCYASYRGEVGQ